MKNSLRSSASAIQQLAAAAPLQLVAWEPPPGDDALLEVLACSPGPWDRCPPPAWPRVGGGVLAGRDDQGALWLCGGYLPCGRCGPCSSGMLLACREPIRPGWNAPGGLASSVRLPGGAAPAELVATTKLPQIVALLGAAGLTYQAQSMAGMIPGDSVLVVGDPGPGALPLRLLAASGLRPVQAQLETTDLPSQRCHLVDLEPSSESLGRWEPVAGSCLSLSLLGPPRPELSGRLSDLLAGQTCLRWIRDLHPHLVLDVAALVATGRITLENDVEVLPRAEAAPVIEKFLARQAERWPVVV